MKIKKKYVLFSNLCKNIAFPYFCCEFWKKRNIEIWKEVLGLTLAKELVFFFYKKGQEEMQRFSLHLNFLVPIIAWIARRRGSTGTFAGICDSRRDATHHLPIWTQKRAHRIIFAKLHETVVFFVKILRPVWKTK